jgi:hypothetical protein
MDGRGRRKALHLECGLMRSLPRKLVEDQSCPSLTSPSAALSAVCLLSKNMQGQQCRNYHCCIQAQRMPVPSFLALLISGFRMVKLVKQSHEISLQHGNGDLAHQRHIDDTRDSQQQFFVHIFERGNVDHGRSRLDPVGGEPIVFGRHASDDDRGLTSASGRI